MYLFNSQIYTGTSSFKNRFETLKLQNVEVTDTFLNFVYFSKQFCQESRPSAVIPFYKHKNAISRNSNVFSQINNG